MILGFLLGAIWEHRLHINGDYAMQNSKKLRCFTFIIAPKHGVSYKYEANRDLMTIIDNQVSEASISKYKYNFDALGRRFDRSQSGSAIDNESTDTFEYNVRSEVIGSTNSVETAVEWNPSYDYDKIGNRKESTGFISATYTANALNQYDTFTPRSLELTTPDYDEDGNLLSSV